MYKDFYEAKFDYGQRQGWLGKYRYWVEERLGCVAVCDWKIVKNLPYKSLGNDLKADSKGVVWFKQGKVCEGHCKTCGQGHYNWYVPKELILEALEVADNLNLKNNTEGGKEKSKTDKKDYCGCGSKKYGRPHYPWDHAGWKPEID
jgi:hypothetical protein